MIESIILCEFHDIIGKQAILQYPKEQSIDVKILGDFLLPKEDLSGKLLMIEYQSEYIINIPMVMRNKIYTRAIYVISVAVKVNKEQFTKNQEAYFEIVRKLAYVISQLEANRCLISDNARNKDEILQLIEKIYLEVNQSSEHESFVEFDDSQFMFLRIPQQVLSPKIQNLKYSQVPFPIVNLKKGVQTNFDPILEKLLPEINGINSVGAICQKLKPYKAEQVKNSLKEMVEFSLIKMVDIIKTTNMYIINDNFFSHEFKEQAIYSLINKDLLEQQFGKITSLDVPRQILQTLYIEFKRGVTLREYVKRFQVHLTYISITKLIRYGELNNFLNRLHEYVFICSGNLKGQSIDDLFDGPPQNYMRACERFNEEDKKERDQQIFLMESSLEYSRRFEGGVEGQSIGQRLKDQEKTRDANEMLKQMLQNQETVDEICLIFNLDLEQFKSLIQNKDYVIIHK